MHFMSSLQRVTNSHMRHICFDRRIAQTWFVAVNDVTRHVPNSWLHDNLHAGSTVQTQHGSLYILCRTNNYVCMVKDINSGQFFSVRAVNLPVQRDLVTSAGKRTATTALAAMFDHRRVRNITIRMPFTAAAPITFDSVTGIGQTDPDHPYLIIRYFDKSPCTAFACTSAPSPPHRTPKIAVVDENIVDSDDSMWTAKMPRATAIDLSRMASFPDCALKKHFQIPVTTAKYPRLVLSAMKQVLLAHAALNGVDCTDNLPGGELDIGQHEEQLDELDLVIGHYDVDENNRPLPGAL